MDRQTHEKVKQSITCVVDKIAEGIILNVDDELVTNKSFNVLHKALDGALDLWRSEFPTGEDEDFMRLLTLISIAFIKEIMDSDKEESPTELH